MRWLPAVMLVVLAVVPSVARAGCVGPQVGVADRRVPPGGVVEVTGRFFVDGCDDVGGTGTCGAPLPREEEVPMTGVRFELRHGGGAVDVVEVDADEEGTVRAVLSVPADALPGRYHVVAIYWERPQRRVPVLVTHGRR